MKKKIQRNFVEPNKISKHLYCSICSEVFREPLRLLCGHTFCKLCINKWLNYKLTCPICRKIVNFKYASTDQIAVKIVDELHVKCNNDGCNWLDKLEYLKKHLSECKYVKKEIPEWINQINNVICIDDEKQNKLIEIRDSIDVVESSQTEVENEIMEIRNIELEQSLSRKTNLSECNQILDQGFHNDNNNDHKNSENKLVNKKETKNMNEYKQLNKQTIEVPKKFKKYGFQNYVNQEGITIRGNESQDNQIQIPQENNPSRIKRKPCSTDELELEINKKNNKKKKLNQQN